MIIVDTSVWIDHLRSTDANLVVALTEGRVLQHAFVTAELALGTMSMRDDLITKLGLLRQADVVTNRELLAFIEDTDLSGTGVGMVDAHLLASAAAGEGIRLWSRDKRLATQAERLGLAFTH